MINTALSSPGQTEKPFFRASQRQPYHLSIGAVLFNQKEKELSVLMQMSLKSSNDHLATLILPLEKNSPLLHV